MNDEIFNEIDELLFNKKYESVIELIESLDEDEISPQISMMLSYAYSCIENNSKALKILLSVSDDVDDDDLMYHFSLANCYYGLHKYLSALKETDKCIEIDENFVDVWVLKCYIALDKDDENMFELASKKVKELDEETWNECFGSDSAVDELAIYEPDELKAVLKHISKYFGKISKLAEFADEDDNPINVIYIEPDKQKNYITVITVGLGAYNPDIPEDFDGSDCGRIELVAYLPPDWDIDSIDINYSWVARCLQAFGAMIQFDETWLAPGHTISNGLPFAPNTKLNGAIIADLIFVDEQAKKCLLPNGDTVSFYQFIPIYEEEMLYKINNSYMDLFDRLSETFGLSYRGAIDIKRPNVCEDMKEKDWAIPKSSIGNILEWTGPDGCFATDKIMVENKQIRFMYREKPENEYDSGWRFMAGDETEEYMNNVDNMGIYSLNTLCNYDIGIIDFLDSPVGTILYRNKNGDFVKS